MSESACSAAAPSPDLVNRNVLYGSWARAKWGTHSSQSSTAQLVGQADLGVST